MNKDYKKLYEEALKRARYYHDRDNIHFLEHIFPELRESEDERIRKGLIKGLSAMKDIHHHQTFSDDAINIDDAIAWLEKQGEQKHTDESEPKFKTGDWITNGKYTWKVTDIQPLDYILQSQNGDTVDDTISHVDEEFHLWTIRDAKDGDVLSSGNPFIFRDFGDKRHPNSPTAYCGINSSGTFILSMENDWWTANDVHPATKEQCNLLFKKMYEAGYEWDAEKKELRKIEQKPTWSEEDERMLTRIINEMEAIKSSSSTIFEKNIAQEKIDWLKSLKPQTHWKPSEVQMKALKFVVDYFGELTEHFAEYDEIKSLYNDLKSL